MTNVERKIEVHTAVIMPGNASILCCYTCPTLGVKQDTTTVDMAGFADWLWICRKMYPAGMGIKTWWENIGREQRNKHIAAYMEYTLDAAAYQQSLTYKEDQHAA